MNEIMEYLVSLFSNLLKRNDDLYKLMKEEEKENRERRLRFDLEEVGYSFCSEVSTSENLENLNNREKPCLSLKTLAEAFDKMLLNILSR